MNTKLMRQLSICGIDIQSYLLLKRGFKPVIRLDVTENNPNNIENFIKVSETHVFIKTFDEYYDQKLSRPLSFAYISLSEDLAQEAYEANKTRDLKSLGKLLGYPECCIDSFIRNLGTSVNHMIESFLNTKTKLSFYCNSLFNFDSKVDEYLNKIYHDYYNIFTANDNFFLIRHMPCAFDCKKSIEIGRKTLEILEEELPELAEKIVFALKKPILYFDYFNWIVFYGNLKDNVLYYSKVLPYKSLFPGNNLKIIKEGNRIEVLDDKIIVYKDSKFLLKIEKQDKYKGVIMDFS